MLIDRYYIERQSLSQILIIFKNGTGYTRKPETHLFYRKLLLFCNFLAFMMKNYVLVLGVSDRLHPQSPLARVALQRAKVRLIFS